MSRIVYRKSGWWRSIAVPMRMSASFMSIEMPCTSWHVSLIFPSTALGWLSQDELSLTQYAIFPLVTYILSVHDFHSFSYPDLALPSTSDIQSNPVLFTRYSMRFSTFARAKAHHQRFNHSVTYPSTYTILPEPPNKTLMFTGLVYLANTVMLTKQKFSVMRAPLPQAAWDVFQRIDYSILLFLVEGQGIQSLLRDN